MLTCPSLPLFNTSFCIAGVQFPSTGSPRNQSRRLRSGTSWARMTLPLSLARWVLLAMMVHFCLLQQLLLCINQQFGCTANTACLHILQAQYPARGAGRSLLHAICGVNHTCIFCVKSPLCTGGHYTCVHPFAQILLLADRTHVLLRKACSQPVQASMHECCKMADMEF